MKKIKFFILGFFSFFLFPFVSAHCPLCTIGAGAAAAGAVWLGVSKVVVALFIGAFAMSMGMWFARWAEAKKKIIPFQKTIIVVLVFLSTVIPLMPIFSAIGPLYLSFVGEYGKTFAVNYSFASVFFGGLIVLSSPTISKQISKKRGKTIPFQGVTITLGLLLISGGVIQLLV